MKKYAVAVLGVTLLSSLNAAEVAEVYKARCANCHGVTANGVPKLKEAAGISQEKASHMGVASETRNDIYGPPLNNLSSDELLSKLMNLRNTAFDATNPHSVMRQNLQTIEEREGRIDDQAMADYISSTFGN